MSTLTVSNLTDLYAALAQAKGGETILLEGGDYGKLELLTFKTFGVKAIYDSEVTIKSADPDNPASFSGMDLREVRNLTFDDVVFDSDYTGGSVWVAPFQVSNSTGITIRNSLFQGELASGTGDPATDGFATGKGLTIGGSTGVVIENNEFTTWHRALTVGGSQDVTITGNDVHDIRSDGMDFAGVQNVLIEGNYIHDFERSEASADHADMIQFWTNGTSKPSTDITIRGNILDIGEGDSTQSIFMRNDMVDRGLAGPEMFYQNILIEENVITNGHSHGITVGETDGLVIRNNSVLHADGGNVDGADASVEIPKINVASASVNVTIANNLTAAITGATPETGWYVSQNVLVQDQDPNAPNHYGDVFIASSLNPEDGLHQFLALPGGVIAAAGAGATATRDTAPDGVLDARFHITDPADNGAARVFDARLTVGDFEALPSDAKFLWDFGDGTTAAGAVVNHAFAQGGWYDVKLTVAANGLTATETARVGVKGPEVVSLGANGGFVASSYGVDTLLDPSAMASSEGIQLGTAGAAGVAREYLAGLFEADNFAIAMTLKADAAGTSGELFRIHQSFLASVTSTGELQFQLWTTESGVTVTTTGANLSDLAAHDIAVSFEEGKLQVFVDGTLNAEAAVSGTISTAGTAGLSFGNPWGKANFFGDLTAFDLTVDDDAFAPELVAQINGATMQVVSDEAPTQSSEDVAPDTTPDGGTDTTTDAAPDATPDGGTDPVATDPAPEPEPEPEPAPAPEPEAALPSPLHEDDFAGLFLDIAALGGKGPGPRLIDDAAVIETDQGPAVAFDGDRDYLNLGRIAQFEDAAKVGFSVDFTDTGGDTGEERLVWNHLKLGLTLKDDGILVQVATQDEGFKGFAVADLGLEDGQQHRAAVLLDTTADRLQVLVDDKVVLDVQDGTDFDIDGNGREWGWSIGTAWNRFFDGEVSDFRMGDRFEFVDDQQPAQEDALV